MPWQDMGVGAISAICGTGVSGRREACPGFGATGQGKIERIPGGLGHRAIPTRRHLLRSGLPVPLAFAPPTPQPVASAPVMTDTRLEFSRILLAHADAERDVEVVEMDRRFAGLAGTQHAGIHGLRHDPQGRPIFAGTVGSPETGPRPIPTRQSGLHAGRWRRPRSTVAASAAPPRCSLKLEQLKPARRGSLRRRRRRAPPAAACGAVPFAGNQPEAVQHRGHWLGRGVVKLALEHVRHCPLVTVRGRDDALSRLRRGQRDGPGVADGQQRPEKRHFGGSCPRRRTLGVVLMGEKSAGRIGTAQVENRRRRRRSGGLLNTALAVRQRYPPRTGSRRRWRLWHNRK